MGKLIPNLKNKKVIAVVGLPGSGKSVVIDYLIEGHGWPKVYFGDPTFEEIKKRGLPVTETNERAAREYLRKKFGQDVYAIKTAEKIDKITGAKVVLAESLYSMNEYKYFINKFGDNFITLAVYSPPKIRHERLGVRKERPLTPKECISRDYSQIDKCSQAGPIALADYTIVNASTLDNIYRQCDKIINLLNA